MNAEWKQLVSFCEMEKSTLQNFLHKAKHKIYFGKVKPYSIIAAMSTVGKSTDWLIIYYMAKQNFEFVYLIIPWGLKTTYLRSICFYLFQWEILGDSDNSLFSVPLFCHLLTPHILNCVRLLWASSRQLCK